MSNKFYCHLGVFNSSSRTLCSNINKFKMSICFAVWNCKNLNKCILSVSISSFLQIVGYHKKYKYFVQLLWVSSKFIKFWQFQTCTLFLSEWSLFLINIVIFQSSEAGEIMHNVLYTLQNNKHKFRNNFYLQTRKFCGNILNYLRI